jgi:hypothetical protein
LRASQAEYWSRAEDGCWPRRSFHNGVTVCAAEGLLRVCQAWKHRACMRACKATVLRLLHLPFASYGIWSYLHRSCGHLPSLAKTLSSVAMPKFAPPLCLSNPFPAIFRIILRALPVPQFQITAFRNIVHGNFSDTVQLSAEAIENKKTEPLTLHCFFSSGVPAYTGLALGAGLSIWAAREK